ncbi:MAG: hypothetical protein ACOCVU_05890 [Desulfohalobiaceae bacterium]
MIRTQIQLTDEQYRRLKEVSHESHESLAAVVRKALDQFLFTRRPDRSVLYRQAQAVAGRHVAGRSDIAREHDAFLEEGYLS